MLKLTLHQRPNANSRLNTTIQFAIFFLCSRSLLSVSLLQFWFYYYDCCCFCCFCLLYTSVCAHAVDDLHLAIYTISRHRLRPGTNPLIIRFAWHRWMMVFIFLFRFFLDKNTISTCYLSRLFSQSPLHHTYHMNELCVTNDQFVYIEMTHFFSSSSLLYILYRRHTMFVFFILFSWLWYQHHVFTRTYMCFVIEAICQFV